MLVSFFCRKNRGATSGTPPKNNLISITALEWIYGTPKDWTEI